MATNFLSSVVKRSQDAEEIKETTAKVNARRKKAYKNYEQSCEISGKFKVRTCPTLEQCYASQGKGFNHTVVKEATTTTTAKTTTIKGIIFNLDENLFESLIFN